ncbi:MAG: hypothetical protein ACTHZ1_13795 [Sphingobacterium sp.]
MSNIKERVLQIAEVKGIPKIEFFKALGISYANFKGAQKKAALGSDAISVILNHFSDIHAEWLVLGEGAMIKEEQFHSGEIAITLPSKIDRFVDSTAVSVALEKVIGAQQITIQSQEVAIAALTARIEQLEKKKKHKRKP